MGLELVELVLDTEREFGIEVSNQEAEEIGRLGELYELLLVKLEVSRRGLCPTQLAFCRVRQTLLERSELERREIRPGLSTETALKSASKGEKPLSWSSFERSLDMRLVHPRRSRFGRHRSIPNNCATLGGLSWAPASLNLPRLLGRSDPRVDVWSRLTEVIKNCLSLPEDMLLWQNRFVDDLGCG